MDPHQQQQQPFLGSAFSMPDFTGGKLTDSFGMPEQHGFQAQHQLTSDDVHRQQQHHHHAQSRSMSQLDADVAFFASSERSSFSGSAASLSPRSTNSSALGHNNALGLLEGADAPASSAAMEHSQSMSGLDFVVLSHPQLRRTSISDLSDTSRSSFSGASSQHSHHSFGGDQSPRSFTPSQSPLKDLSSLSGLALGTPIRQSSTLSYGSASTRSSPGANPDEGGDARDLLSLTTDGGAAPGAAMGFSKPLAPPMKRRDTALAHSLYTHGGRTEVDDDVTPMPPSTGRFVGQRAAPDIHSAGAPFTPSQSSSRVSVGSAVSTTSSIYQTPAQSHSSTTTPLSQTFESPFGGFGGPFDGASGSLPQGKSLEAMWAQRELQQQMQMGAPSPHGSATGLAGPFEPNPSPRSSISGPPSHLEHGMMSRTVSAPFALPHGHPMGPPAPSTPARNTMPPTLYSGAFTAPMMHTSHSSGSLASPLAVSPMSLADRSLETGMPLPSPGGSLHRAPSSASRNRSRNTGPPPLIVSSADKLHVCHCGKRFKRMEHLKRHNRTHTQERPHRCPFDSCGKWFGRSDNLAQHLKTHFRAVGSRSAELLALTKGDESEPRHDPHAAAAAAARAAERKVAAGLQGKKRSSTISTFSNELGGPISLAAPDSTLQQQHQQFHHRGALTPTGGVSVNSSPSHHHSEANMEQSSVPSWA